MENRVGRKYQAWRALNGFLKCKGFGMSAKEVRLRMFQPFSSGRNLWTESSRKKKIKRIRD